MQGLSEEEELELLELEEEEYQASLATAPAPVAKKAPTAIDMIAPSASRPLSADEMERMETQAAGNAYNPAMPVLPGQKPMPLVSDPRIATGAMDAVNTGSRAIGAAIPTDFTRGKNADGSSRSFSEAMADSETGLTRGWRDAASEGVSTNLEAFKSAGNGVDKALSAAKAGFHGLSFLLASVVEPGGAGALKGAGKAVKAAATGGKSLAKSAAETYMKEVGVPRPALERLAEPGGTQAIKDASFKVDNDVQQEVADMVEAIRAPKLDRLTKDEKKIMEGYQEKLEAIMEEKVGKSAEAQKLLDARLRELDQEVRDFMENVKTRTGEIKDELGEQLETGKADIQAGAEELKAGALSQAPKEILGDIPRADRLKAGDQLQGAMTKAEQELSDRYGELKGAGFGLDEAQGHAIPGGHNPLARAFDRVMKRSFEQTGTRNALSKTEQEAYEKMIRDATPPGGLANIPELIRARQHIGKTIYGKSGLKEQDELFRSFNRATKEAFYHEINEEIGNELGRFYRKKNIPDDMAAQMVEGWDRFNQEYAGLRSGMETIKQGVRFSAAGGKTDNYASKIFSMGTNDLRKAKAATTSSETTKPVWEAVEGAVINDLVDEATDANGVFSIQKFNRAWGELATKEREKLEVLLGADRVKAIESYNKSVQGHLAEIDALAEGDLDGLVKGIAGKKKALEAKTQTAKGAVSVYKKVRAQAIRRDTDELEVGAAAAAVDKRRNAKEVRDLLLESMERKRAEVEAIGTVALAGKGKGNTPLARAMSVTNMTGPQRKVIMEELEKRFGAEKARELQDIYFAKAIGARDGGIPALGRLHTGRALYLGFISGHPLAAALATSPQVAATALRFGSKPAGKLGQAVEKVTTSPKLMNLYQVLGGLSKVEARNRVVLRIVEEMQREGIDLEEFELDEEKAAPMMEAANLQVMN
jgi:hypothetical protein